MSKSQPRIREYSSFGGSNFDSIAHASLFRADDSHNFGVMTARLFSSVMSPEYGTLGSSYKSWINLTQAKGNVVYTSPGKDTYRWQVVGDSHVQLKITKKYVTPGELVGQAGARFFIGVNLDWFANPTVFKTQDDNAASIVFMGEPVPDGPNNFKVECRIQDGNVVSFLDDKLLDPGQTLSRVGTLLSNELNTEYGTLGFSSQSELSGQIGRVGNTISFTDRFLRMEKSTKGNGMGNMSYSFGGNNYNTAFSTGHVYSAMLSSNGQKVEKGMVVPTAERLIMDQTMYDQNFMMEFGRLETTLDDKSKRQKKVGAGWRQLYRDGQYRTHSGDFTLDWLYEVIHQIVHNKRQFMNRNIVLRTGTGGMTYISKLIADSVPIGAFIEPGFGVKPNSNPAGIHEVEYEYGFMFTKIKLPMGVTCRLMYDPNKDNQQVYTQLAPGSYLPVESFQIDILEFGDTEDALENSNNKSNITMVKETMGDYFFTINNAMKPDGPVTGGENVYKFGKEHEIYYETTGSLAVWDTSAVGRIEWVI